MISPAHLTPFDHAAFQNPTAKNRIAPFWFWNGAMAEELVREQIEAMAGAGVGGFFIHARQGLTLPYLSKEWFKRVKIAVEAAQKHGMEAWLYDEYPYPSGIAGGLLTANRPEFRARVLEHFEFDISTETALIRREFPLGRIVCALAFPLQNGRVSWDEAVDIRAEIGVVLTRELFWRWPMAHIPYNEKRFMADAGKLVLEWMPPREIAGETSNDWRVFVGIESEQSGFKYFDCFVDPLVPGAAQEFIELTHEGYARVVGEHFGTTIPGIFTDEIEPPAWSPQTENALAKNGLAMSELLPALYFDEHPRASELRFAWRDCGVKLFYERWEKPIADWCAAHNLAWTVEKPTARPAQFAAFSQPATDAGHRRADLPPETLGGGDLRANHRAAIAAAEQQGREEVRCECFHSLGWGATLQDQKWAIDWLCVQGVNRFTPHAFYATSSGLAKHDAAPSFFLENPYWPHFRALGDYAGRLGAAMSAGRERARIALLHPTESQWVKNLQSATARREYEWLMNDLLANHHSFHPVDALALLQAEAKNGALELGHTRYETLLIPPLCAANSQTLDAVRAALNAGMRVLMAPPLQIAPELQSDLPHSQSGLPHSQSEASGSQSEASGSRTGKAGSQSDNLGLRSDNLGSQSDDLGSRSDDLGLQLETLWMDAREMLSWAGVETVTSREVWNEKLAAERALWVRDADGAELREVWALWREAGAQQLLFLCNTSARAVEVFVEVRASVGGWGNWSLESGETATIAAKIEGGCSEIALKLAPFGSVLLVGDAEKSAAIEVVALARATILDTAGDWEFRPENANALRLNRWKIAALDGDGASPEIDDEDWREVEALPLKFLDQVAREWVEALPDRGEKAVWYRRRVRADFVPDDLRILIENGAISGDWTLFVNGHELPKSEFSPASFHGADKIAAPVSRFFREGDNLLALRVENAPEMGGLRTPLHLIGSFALGESALSNEKRTLIALPETAQFGLLVAAGLPHFSGGATYCRELESADLGAVLALPAGFEEIAEVRLDGKSLGARCWSPYEWSIPDDLPATVRVEITLTNTLLPFIEGRFWDAPTHQARPV